MASKQSEEDNKIDATKSDNDDVPLLMVALPQMPKGAVSEVELICATNKAAECLDMENYYGWSSEANCNEISSEQNGWDMGYDGAYNEKRNLLHTHYENIQIESVARSIGKGCSVISNTVAYFKTRASPSAGIGPRVNVILLLQDMADAVINSIEGKSELDKSSTLHLRLFYVTSAFRDCGFDTSALRCTLRSVITSKWSQLRASKCSKNMMGMNQIPAYSIVPVDAIFSSPSPSLQTPRDGSAVLGMQVVALDLIHLQTEMWLHSNRNRN